MSRQFRILGLGCVVFAGVAVLQSRAQGKEIDDLSGASIEKLTQLQVSVSSASRKEEDLWMTPSAVFVISREDIERSAATSVPELLRMVPGVQVAQATASTWAVSARGFNSESADKLLVLIDGRTVYSEIFSGVHWDESDLPLEEIERIEVVRGPGAAVWGTNAVNGVVNIITRRARSTIGFAATGSLGRIGQSTVLRYGGALGDRVQYRAYASFVNRSPFGKADGTHEFDGENTVREGGRLDWQRSRADLFTFSADHYGGDFKERISPTVGVPKGPEDEAFGSLNGEYVLGRWRHNNGERSDSGLQFYFDDTSRHDITAYFRTRTLDLDFSNHLALGSRNDLVWGGEVRFTGDHINSPVPLLSKPDYRNYLVDGFAQDDISLISKRLVLTVGSKVQDGTLAGFQLQPSIRMLWSPATAQSIWGGVSRAVVAPTVSEDGLSLPLDFGLVHTPAGTLPLTGLEIGNPDYKPETVLAYEAGYRQRIGNTLTLDLAVFLNKHKRLEAAQDAPIAIVPTPAPHLFVLTQLVNGYDANTAGMESTLLWKPLNTLSVQGSYTWMQAKISQALPGVLSLTDSWAAPRNTVAVTSSWSFAPRWRVDTFVYHVDALPRPMVGTALSTVASSVPAYTRVDLHLARKLGRTLMLDAGATNLLRPRHLEFGSGSDILLPAYLPRSFFVKGQWTF